MMLRIGVIGDILNDQYVIGEMTRFAPEGGQPVFSTRRSFTVPGGAANTAEQLHHWNVKASLFGCPCGTKRRFFNDGHYVFRQDIETPVNDTDRTVAIDGMLAAIPGLDGVILSDYDKGTITPASAKAIIQSCRDRNIVCVVDPKGKSSDVYAGCTAIKANADYLYQADVRTFGAEPPNVMGISFFRKPPVNVVSVVGAGDCFAAALTVWLCRGLSIHDAAELAHSAGRVYVQRPYNEPVHPLEVAKDMDPIGGKITDAATMASYLKARRHGAVFTNGCFELLHPGHLHTLSWARLQGDVLIVGVNTDESMARIKRVPTIPCKARCRVLAGLACVDFVVPFSQNTARELIGSLRPAMVVKGPDTPRPFPEEGIVPVAIAPPSSFTPHSSDLLK